MQQSKPRSSIGHLAAVPVTHTPPARLVAVPEPPLPKAPPERPTFEQIVDANLRDELTHFARKLARSRHRADDVVQDALIRAMRAWDDVDLEQNGRSAQENARTWLFRIVSNTFINNVRDERRHQELVHDNVFLVREELYGEIGHGQVTPAVGADSPYGDEVFEALSRLDNHHRDVVELHFVRGLTPEQTARTLGVATSTIHTRLNRMKKLLRPMLGEFATAQYGIGDE